MKILLSAYACRPNCGSEDGNGWNWAINLAKMNHEVWVLTRHNNEKYIAQVIDLMPNLHFIYVKNTNNIFSGILSYTRFNWQYLYFNWQRQALKESIKLDKKFDFNIVHHVSWGSITAGSWLWKLDKPFVFGPVGGGQIAPTALKKYFLEHWKNESLRSLLFRRLAKFNLISLETVSKSHLVLATNQDTYELAEQMKARRVELLFDPGLPENYFPKVLSSQKVQQKKLKLLWVGSLIPRKGIRLSLESLSKVSSEIPFELTIIGDGSQSQYLPEWIQEFGLEKAVNYCGRLSRSEVKKAYSNHDVFFFTSLRDSCPTQLLEAMSHGLPIITLDIHGARKFVQDQAGIKVVVRDADQVVRDLAYAVKSMYKNPQRRSEMGIVGYEFAKTQIWSKKISKAVEYYNELLER